MEVVNQNGVVYNDDQTLPTTRWGLGGLLFLTDCFLQLRARKIDLNDLIEIGDVIQKENLNCHVKFFEGELYTVGHLLKLFIVTQSPQIPLALSPYLNAKTNKKSLIRIHELATHLSIDLEKVVNITGRPHKNHEQGFDAHDLKKIAEKWLALPSYVIKLLRTTQVEHRHTTHEAVTRLLDDGAITHGFFWREQQVVIALNQTQQSYAVLRENYDVLTQDLLLAYAVQNNEPFKLEPQCIELGQYRQMNLSGDFYLGEWYSRRRNQRKILDYYTEKGASYCFDGLKHLFPKNQLNIVNSESSVVDFKNIVSPYVEYKKFILDAEPSKLFPALDALNVQAVLLANNHSYDFGSQGLSQTLQYFKQYNVQSIGVGENLNGTLNYFKVDAGYKNVYFFSAYWFRGNQYFDYDCYAKENKSGVGSINPFLYQMIRELKAKDPKAFVIVSPHWGVDFKPTSGVQRNLAKHLIEAGTDLIIGHGSHSLQSIEKIDGKFVIYSLGNFVFNSDGEFDVHQAPKFGLFAHLDFEKDPMIKITPLNADNHATQFQPRPVNQSQFEAVQAFYKKPIEDGLIQVDVNTMCLNISLTGE